MNEKSHDSKDIKKTLIPPIFSGLDILCTEFPEPNWSVPDLLPEGLTIFGGKSEYIRRIIERELGLRGLKEDKNV